MTPREKILRDALQEARYKFNEIESEHGKHDNLAWYAIRDIDDSLEQADKAGPSGHDKRKYEVFRHALFDQKDRLTWREEKELFNMLKQAWGIE